MEIIPESGWADLLDKLKRNEGAAIILGTTDSGKSTLAKFLIKNLLPENHKVSFVDSDIGQSSLGLPGTICQKTFHKPEDINDFRPEKIFFIGSLSPAEKIGFMIEGTKTMANASRVKTAKKIIIDTTGLITGEIGRALKIGKIRAVGPRHIIALQRHDELEHILAMVEGKMVHRLHVSQYVKRRYRERRIQYREKKFMEYFEDPYRMEIPLKNVEFFYNGNPFNRKVRYIKQGSLLGLNQNGDTIAVGIFEKISMNKVAIITPLENCQDINRIVVGDILLDQFGA